jgi:hypothetical protein
MANGEEVALAIIFTYKLSSFFSMSLHSAFAGEFFLYKRLIFQLVLFLSNFADVLFISNIRLSFNLTSKSKEE